MEYELLIKQMRILRRMTQAELARKAKVRQPYISQLESIHPVKSPTLRILFNIAVALDVCPHILVRYNINCEQNCFHNCQKGFFLRFHSVMTL